MSTVKRADNGVALILVSIRERLAMHPHFRGRASLLTIELVDKTVILSGRLPSHYLKQLLQEAVKGMPGVVNIENHVEVLWPSFSPEDRPRMIYDRSGAQTTNEREVQ